MTGELVREMTFPRVCESGTEASKQTFEKLTITLKKNIRNSGTEVVHVKGNPYTFLETSSLTFSSKLR